MVERGKEQVERQRKKGGIEWIEKKVGEVKGEENGGGRRGKKREQG